MFSSMLMLIIIIYFIVLIILVLIDFVIISSLVDHIVYTHKKKLKILGVSIMITISVYDKLRCGYVAFIFVFTTFL